MLCALIKAGSFKEKDLLGRCWPGSDKIDVMGNRTCGGRAAKGAQLELCMRSCVIMRAHVVMQGRHARHGGTQFQREGNAVRRHEARGNISTKQEQGQHEDAGP